MVQIIHVDALGRDRAADLGRAVLAWPGVEIVELAQGPFAEPADWSCEADWRCSLLARLTVATPRDVEAYQYLLDCVTAANRWYLDNGWGKRFRLYRSGVRYHREPLGFELCQTIPALAIRGKGDCEDLACARAAEIGGKAVIVEEGTNETGGRNFHVIVRKGRKREDPSKRLGMGQ